MCDSIAQGTSPGCWRLVLLVKTLVALPRQCGCGMGHRAPWRDRDLCPVPSASGVACAMSDDGPVMAASSSRSQIGQRGHQERCSVGPRRVSVAPSRSRR
jgi:hypothetical protein